jgi:hypothetical protein
VARLPRDTAAGVFHVFTHCVWAAPAHYRDDVDRLAFLRRLARVTATMNWRCIGFCLMRTHYHLIVEAGEGVLPVAMQSLNHGYSVGFQPPLRTSGTCPVRPVRVAADPRHRRLARDVRVRDEQSRRGRLCPRASVWPWSSFRGTLGILERNSFIDDGPILACFRRELDPVAALRRAVEKI